MTTSIFEKNKDYFFAMKKNTIELDDFHKDYLAATFRHQQERFQQPDSQKRCEYWEIHLLVPFELYDQCLHDELMTNGRFPR